jgi:glycyl-tRNA synthetase beta chain
MKNMSDLLLEILVEELPARFVDSASSQLCQLVVNHLDELYISHGDARGLATPRRLVVLVQSVAEATEPRTADVKGPPRLASYDSDGHPTAALAGFCRTQEVDVSEVHDVEMQGRTYVFATKTIPGQQSSRLIESFLPRLLREISFPKTMRWEESGLQFARPIRALTALLGETQLSWEAAGVVGSNTTFGLRVGKPRPISFVNADEYFRKLREAFVILDRAERKRSIEKQASRLLSPSPFHLGSDADTLFDDVVNLVEYPTVFLGELPATATGLPAVVVRSVLEEQMHSFPLYDGDNAIAPQFLSVRNGLGDFIEKVRHGSENVANARLMDASFFIKEDTRHPLASFVPKLDSLMFMDRLGNMAQKTSRLETMARHAGEYSKLSPHDVDVLAAAARVAKADLATSMVKEYTSLQGEMGRVYLEKEGAPADVAAAVREQYLPRSATDAVASTRCGRLLGILDRVDTIVGILGTGFNPSGSEDPYGIRRAGNAIVRTILEQAESIDLERLTSVDMRAYEESGIQLESGNLQTNVLEYLAGRVVQYYKERQSSRDYAPFDALPLDQLATVPARINALRERSGDAGLSALADSHRRIQNITKGIEDTTVLPADLPLTEPEERTLRDNAEVCASNVSRFLSLGQYGEAIRSCEALTPSISQFFDKILVMTHDDSLRSARLLLLCYLKHILGSVCDFSRLV